MTNNNDIDDFTATYLLGSTQRQVSSEDTTNPNYFEAEGGGTISPDLFFTQHQQQQPRTMSQVSKESFDLSEAEREAHEFMNQLQSNASSDENMRNSHQDINELSDTRRKSFCLLYTSPSPRDATLSRMPSSA